MTIFGIHWATLLGAVAGLWAILTIVHFLRAEGEYRRLRKATLEISEKARRDLEERRLLGDVKFASDCPPCPDCGEPYCFTCNAHYADCSCKGPHSEDVA